MSWWDRWTGRDRLSAIETKTWATHDVVVAMNNRLIRMGTTVADTSVLLNDVAAGLRDRLGPRISEVLAENASLRAENASLKGEDVAESAAADAVKAEFDSVAGLFDQTDEAPTPEPLSEPPAAEPTGDDAA